jgi:hypothetical protein
LAFVVTLISLYTGEALACSCLESRPPCEAYGNAAVIFVGQVKAIEIIPRNVKSKEGEELRQLGGEGRRANFAVTEVFHGVSGTEVDVYTAGNGAACGYGFELGEKYIVYTYRQEDGDGKLWTNICTRTQKFSETLPDLAYARSWSKASPGASIFGTATHTRQNANSTEHSQVPMVGVRVRIEGNGKNFEVKTDERG